MLEFAPVRLGPFALDGDRAWAALVVAAFVLAAEAVARRRGGRADDAWAAVLIGVAVARLAYVGVHADVFAARPWETLYLWQGGFVGWAGGAAAVLTVFVRRVRSSAPPAFGGAPFAAAAVVGFGAAMFLPAPEASRPLADWTASVATLDGGADAASSWVGTPTVVNLWASWCGPCRREMPMLVEEVGLRPEVRLVLVSQGEGPGPVTAFLEEAGLDADPVRLDPRGEVGREVGLVGLPTTLFVSADGTVRVTAFGELSRARVRSHLAEIATDGGAPLDDAASQVRVLDAFRSHSGDAAR